MRIDLERALHDVADSVHDDVTADRMAGQVRHMVTRVRRRRAARHTAQGVVGLGAASVVTLGALELRADDDVAPAPPADGPHLLEDPREACGRTLEELGWVGTGPVHLEPWPEEPTGRDDGGVSLGTQVVRTADVELDLASASGLRVLAVDPGSGRVVGVPLDDPGARSPDWPAAVAELGLSDEDAQRFPVSTSTPLRDCASDPEEHGPDANLDAGDYEVHAMQVLHPVRPFEGLTTFVAVGGPWPVTVAGEPGTDASGTDGDATTNAQARIAEILAERELADHFPFCGSEVPGPPDDPVLTASLLEPTAGLELVSGERGEVSLELATGGGRHVLADTSPTGTLSLLVDGVVVAYQPLDGDALARVDLSESDRVTLPVRWSAALCGPDGPLESGGIPVPPGEYEAVASVDVLLAEVTEPDGRSREGDGLPYTVVSEPVTVTVTG